MATLAEISGVDLATARAYLGASTVELPESRLTLYLAAAHSDAEAYLGWDDPGLVVPVPAAVGLGILEHVKLSHAQAQHSDPAEKAYKEGDNSVTFGDRADALASIRHRHWRTYKQVRL